MKIMSMADVHGDFEIFDKALETVKKSGAEVLTINGDLNGNVLKEEEKEEFRRAHSLVLDATKQLYEVLRLNGQSGNTINCCNTAKMTLSGQPYFAGADGNARKYAEIYLQRGDEIKERIRENYEKFSEKLGRLEQKVFIVPGNWDASFIDDTLARYNLHMKFPEKTGSFSFAGYGGAREVPLDIPNESAVPFNLEAGFDHLSGKEAEILVVHTPPLKFEGSSLRNGDPYLLAHIYRSQPDLILCGHTHRGYVIREPDTGTFIVNPGLLGRYNNEPFGRFIEINVDEEGVHPITAYDLSRGNSYDIKNAITQ